MASARKGPRKKKAIAETPSPGAALVAKRWQKTTKAQRSAIAKTLAEARWGQKKGRRLP